MKIIKSEIIDENVKLYRDGVNTVHGGESNRDHVIDLFQSKASSVVEMRPIMDGTIY